MVPPFNKMNKKLYIIPGIGQTCNLTRYRRLEKVARAKGYEVFLVNPDWTLPISKQIFDVDKNSVIFGFSMGAILACLVAKKHDCKMIILASISPLNELDFEEMKDFLTTKMSKKRAEEVTEDLKKIRGSYQKTNTKAISLAGEFKNTKADIIVPKTGHRYSSLYNSYVERII